MKLTRATRHLIVAVLALIGSAGAYAYGVMSIEGREANILAAEAQLGAKAQQTAQEQALVQFAQSLSREQEELEARFIHEEDLVGFLADIESIGPNTNTVLLIESVNPQQGFGGGTAVVSTLRRRDQPAEAPSEEGGTPALALSIAVEGEWENVVRALMLIESMPYGTHLSRTYFEYQQKDTAPWRAIIRVIYAARPFTTQ